MIPNRELIDQMADVGEPNPKKANLALYPQVAAGDPDAIKRMIELNMPLVVYKADMFVRAFPSTEYLVDDMISEGFLGLTEAVNLMAQTGAVEEPNPTGFMSEGIKRRIGAVADSGYGSTIASRDDRRRNRSTPMAPAEVRDSETEDPAGMVELRDLIDSCCETDLERQIVALREKAYSDREIAAQLELPYSTIYLTRREIYARFLEKSGMKGEV